MNRTHKLVAALVMSLMAGSVMAGAIHSWASGERLNAADLNANFNHIHNLMVGGHGGRLVDADVSGSAAISTTKLAICNTIPVWPRAWVTYFCDGGACGLSVGENVSSVARSGGNSTVTLGYTPTDGKFATESTFNSSKGFCNTQGIQQAAPQITVHCWDDTGTTAEGQVTVIVYDDNSPDGGC